MGGPDAVQGFLRLGMSNVHSDSLIGWYPRVEQGAELG